ncbi:MAG: hypothetical protein DDT26_01176 [Dehalococcoidia bacterium]|nr:hypothetical protein [Chloroflexota bacterium]
MIAKPSVFLDADALLAGVASRTGASRLILRMSELGLIQSIISTQVREETERNLREKLPQALPAYRALLRQLNPIMVPDPPAGKMQIYEDQADHDDVPILTAAVLAGAQFLVTFNVKHYYPHHGAIEVLRPGELVTRVRKQLAGLVNPEL